MTKKTMKKGLIAAIFSVLSVVMFSGCELLLLGALFGSVANALSCDVKNETSSAITFNAKADPSYSSSSEETDSTYAAADVTATIKAGATKKKAISSGYYKVYVNGSVILPENGEDADTYYYITGDTVLKIRSNGSKYYYVLESRN